MRDDSKKAFDLTVTAVINKLLIATPSSVFVEPKQEVLFYVELEHWRNPLDRLVHQILDYAASVCAFVCCMLFVCANINYCLKVGCVYR